MIRLPDSYNCDACRQVARNFNGIVRRATAFNDKVVIFVYDELEPCNSRFEVEKLAVQFIEVESPNIEKVLDKKALT